MGTTANFARMDKTSNPEHPHEHGDNEGAIPPRDSDDTEHPHEHGDNYRQLAHTQSPDTEHPHEHGDNSFKGIL